MIRSREDRFWIAAGLSSLAAILLFVLFALAALLMSAQEADFPNLDYLLGLARFTLWQALLSSGLSIGVGLPVALALARRPRFAGRGLAMALLVIPLGLPVLPAIFGLLEIWGRTGAVNNALIEFGIRDRFSIYGLPGILLAHVFFNLPLAIRLMLASLQRISRGEWRLAASLGFSRLALLRFVEAPALLRVFPGIFGLIFMLCMTSFTIVLTLGGGPGASTLEVAIYQALKFDYDPARALALTGLQIALTLIVFSALRLFPDPEEDRTMLSARPFRPDGRTISSKLGDAALIVLFVGFMGGPLTALAIAGLKADLIKLLVDPLFLAALATSLEIAVLAGLLSVLLGYLLLTARLVKGSSILLSRLLSASDFILLLPPIALGSGWFVLSLRLGVESSSAMPIVIVINALMALPFVARVLGPALRIHRLQTEKLSLSLGISGWSRLRIVDWPALRPSILIALSFAMALSLGDLGAVALFGGDNFITLPALLYAKLGSYRGTEAAGLSFILALLCLVLMWPALLSRQGERSDV